MEKIGNFFSSIRGSRLIGILVLLLIVAAVPLTVFVARQQQETRQQASGAIPNFRAYCVQTTGTRSTENSCTKIRLYWDAIPNAKWYFIKLYNRDNGSWQGKWSRFPRVEFENISPNQMYEAGIRTFTVDFNACDLSQNYNNSSGVVQKGDCSDPQKDQAAGAWYTQNAPNSPEEMTGQFRVRLPFDGELGVAAPHTLSYACSNATCNFVTLNWLTGGSQIRPLKKFLVRTPPFPAGTVPWLTGQSTTLSVTPNTTYTGWTVQEYQGENDMTDAELYTGGLLSTQTGFPTINTTPPTFTPVPPTNTPVPPTPTSTRPGTTCSIDTQCPTGQFCNSGTCSTLICRQVLLQECQQQGAHTCSEPKPNGTSCASGAGTCQNGSCVANTIAPTRTPSGTTCEVDTNCPAGQNCYAGSCETMKCTTVLQKTCHQQGEHVCTEPQPNGTPCDGGTCQNGACVTTPGSTTLAINLSLTGIGGTCSQANIDAGLCISNPDPKTKTITTSVELVNTQGTITNTTGSVVYDTASKTFKGNIPVPSAIATGVYQIRIKANRYLRQIAGGGTPLTVTTGQSNTVPLTNLIVGDINNDNLIDILDYNMLKTCGNFTPSVLMSNQASKFNTTACQGFTDAQNAKVGQYADLNNDGYINLRDTQLFSESMSKIKGI